MQKHKNKNVNVNFNKIFKRKRNNFRPQYHISRNLKINIFLKINNNIVSYNDNFYQKFNNSKLKKHKCSENIYSKYYINKEEMLKYSNKFKLKRIGINKHYKIC